MTATLVVDNARLADGRVVSIAVRGDRIVAVGSPGSRDVASREATTRIDARGALVTPGIHDSHIHLESGGLASTRADLNEARTRDELLRVVRAYGDAHPDAAWLVGRGFDYDVIESAALDRTDIDGVATDRPVYLESYDGHTGFANTAALERAGVGRTTHDPENGRIGRLADGTPSGLLYEEAMLLVENVIPPPTHEEQLAALRAGLAYCLALGITTIEDIGDAGLFGLYDELRAAGELPIRVRVCPPLGGDLDEYERLRQRYRGPMLGFGFLKAFVDGVIESKTAYMLHDYVGSNERGRPLIAPEDLDRMVDAAHARGFTVALHAIGDAAVRMSLDAYEHAARAHPSQHVRHRVEHIEVIDPDDIGRFAALDVIASMQPYHAVPSDTPGGVWSENLGEERLLHSFSWRDLRAAGATLAFGSDWPVMSANPLWGLAVASTRKNARGLPEDGWYADQAIPVREALAAYTEGSAYAANLERDLGALEPGKWADLVVWSPEVELDDPATLWNGEPEVVVVAGQTRYARAR